jgi:3-deoxy-D-manno-octulosonic-acid transferase
MSLFGAYGFLTDLLAPAARRLLQRRAEAGKEEPARLGERFGRAPVARPAGTLVWAHAASVGEALSLLPLVDRLLARLPEAQVLITTGTITSARLMAERLPQRSLHQFVPIDQRLAVRRFLDHWRPDLALFVESELWPNLILETRRRGVPMALLNARLSERSFRRWHRWRRVTGPLFRSFDLVLAQDARQAEQLRQLGAQRVESVGDMKAGAAPAPVDAAELRQLQDALAGRPVWLAASTHEGEEAAVIAVHRRLRERHPGLVTLLAARHPNRGDAVAALVEAAGIACPRRSRGEGIGPDTEIYLVDTLGEMGLFYRLAPTVFIAGSLGAPGSIGGHNPLEAARLGRAVLHGADMVNCRAVTTALDAAGGALEVAGADGLAEALDRLLADPAAARHMGEAGQRVADAESGVLDRVMSALEPLLCSLGPA